MDLRNLSSDLDAAGRVSERRAQIEKELNLDLNALRISPNQVGQADERNCEQMFGAVPVPVGLAGPLKIQFSSGEIKDIYLPLATTEGALVASVNRGCKAATLAGGIHITSEYVGVTRSIAFEVPRTKNQEPTKKIRDLENEWKKVAEDTSDHLKILSYGIDEKDGVLFLTIAADTDEAMGMNMVTIAAQAVGEFLSRELDTPLLTVAGNVDSDKKPSARTKERGRGYRVKAEIRIPETVIETVLKSNSDSLLKTAHAKLEVGSEIAGALGSNLHAANVIAALYLATGQDAAHVVEGSLTDTRVELVGAQHAVPLLRISVACPAILVGVRGGGTALPAQSKCVELILKERTNLKPSKQLAETIGAAVLAGELSLLAAQATSTLAESHQKHARG